MSHFVVTGASIASRFSLKFQFNLHQTESGGKGQTNFHSKRALEVNLHPSAKRVQDHPWDRALDLDIATRSDVRVRSADMDAQTRHSEGWLALATPRAEVVSTRPKLGKQ